MARLFAVDDRRSLLSWTILFFASLALPLPLNVLAFAFAVFDLSLALQIRSELQWHQVTVDDEVLFHSHPPFPAS